MLQPDTYIRVRATLTETEKRVETEKFRRQYWFRPNEVQNGARTRGLARKMRSGPRETRRPPRFKTGRGGEFGFQTLLHSAASTRSAATNLLSGEQFRRR
jgi:hypothetical protein